MRNPLSVAALGEALTGLILLLRPTIVTRLLFNTDVDGTGAVMSRIAGIALIGLGLACWPSRSEADNRQRAFQGMISYGLMAALYLGYVAIAGGSVGILFYPAIAVHVLLSVLLVRAWSKE